MVPWQIARNRLKCSVELQPIRENRRTWFSSLLTGRIQRVRIRKAISLPITLTSGVPQGDPIKIIIDLRTVITEAKEHELRLYEAL